MSFNPILAVRQNFILSIALKLCLEKLVKVEELVRKRVKKLREGERERERERVKERSDKERERERGINRLR